MIGTVLTGLIAALHLYILWLEMFRWQAPRTRATFGGLDADFAARTRVMAANQGLYNGFLAAGLIWGLWRGDQGVVLFFLTCVAVAGLFGAATVSRRILLVQTMPAVLAMAAVLAGI
ncbi:MAG: DUF1304 domain-containing protein [Paracoccus sp. (in: a-proteobacteria)]|uniref:DUF1304 domain-containing protein n=1 Tax=Paracoccus sp. TaxID=267 RepID=UPI0026E09B32|nr:DUF1304 domain-containing protein [Paracoccus sp. (in: a-proteobacteria)]MDO5612787.1 DUF1304 domain-containing protein [Paracoccus sp. (in: a-proteobacteria)]